MKIIAVSGHLGCGKDFVVRNFLVPMLAHSTPYAIVAFADHFKTESIVTCGLERDKVYGQKDFQTRKALQERGTENGRDTVGKDIWVRILHELVIQYEKRGISMIFITDCRFPNEVQFVESQGGIVIRINAPDRNAIAIEKEQLTEKHISETSLDEYPFRFVIDNSLSNSESVADDVQRIAIENHFQERITVFVDVDDGMFAFDDENIRKFIDELSNQAQVVIISPGSYLEKVPLLYKKGMSHIKLECAGIQTDMTYALLKSKYPSRRFILVDCSYYEGGYNYLLRVYRGDTHKTDRMRFEEVFIVQKDRIPLLDENLRLKE